METKTQDGCVQDNLMHENLTQDNPTLDSPAQDKTSQDNPSQDNPTLAGTAQGEHTESTVEQSVPKQKKNKKKIKQKRLNLYLIDMKYIRDLAHADNNVMSVSPQIGKSSRPFIGIIVVCEEHEYCVPLSSPKEKYKAMKNDVDFTRIFDGEKLIGVLNFNNMVPVAEQFLQPVDLKSREGDNANTKHYKAMAAKQLTWCQKNQDAIVKKANKLYQMIITGAASGILKKRCCDFVKLEKVLERKTTKKRRVAD